MSIIPKYIENGRLKVNDRVVDDITMDFFYKPHTIIILLAVCAFSLYKAVWEWVYLLMNVGLEIDIRSIV